MGLVSGPGRFFGGGHGNPLQYSCLEDPMDRGAWRATVHGVAKSQDMTEHDLQGNEFVQRAVGAGRVGLLLQLWV